MKKKKKFNKKLVLGKQTIANLYLTEMNLALGGNKDPRDPTEGADCGTGGFPPTTWPTNQPSVCPQACTQGDCTEFC